MLFFLIGVVLFVLVLLAVRDMIDSKNSLIKSSNFPVRAEHRINKGEDGILVWVAQRSHEKPFPKWAKHQREWHYQTFGSESFRIIDFIPSSDPDAEEKVLDAVVKAKQLSKECELPYPPEMEELAMVAQRAIER